MENTLVPDLSPRLDSSVSLHLPEQETYVPALTIPVDHPLEYPANAFLKRAIDVVVSLIVIVFILTWLIPLLAILIKLFSKGPVFFMQKRIARYGSVFNCIKLRTMHENAEADILAAVEGDKRITKIGGPLRKYHLDELPQFINVLSGKMSLIGPRPYMLHESKFYCDRIDGFKFRHSVKPGISGLAQSLGNFGNTGNLEEMKSRLAMDQHYINNWSVLLDLKIAFRTLKRIISAG